MLLTSVPFEHHHMISMIILRTTWSSSIDMSDGMHRVFTTFCIVMKRKLKVSSDGQQFRKYQQNEQSSLTSNIKHKQITINHRLYVP